MKNANTIERDERNSGAANAAAQEQTLSLAPLHGSGYGLQVAALRTRAGLAQAWPSAVALIALLLLWQGYVVTSGVDQQLLPTPGAVWETLTTQRAALWDNALVTLWETVVGFGVALATGIALGVLIDLSPWLRRALYPLLVATQAIPLLALAPLLVLWFGPGMISKVIVVTLMCFFPIVVALADGLRGADPGTHQALPLVRRGSTARLLVGATARRAAHAVLRHPHRRRL